MHGVVMKITPQCIVVLCEDGTFRNISRPEVLPCPGERIQVEQESRISRRPRSRTLVSLRHWWIAASLLLLLGTMFWWKNSPLSPPQPATLVAIDINPSIELLVNSEGRVHESRLLNEDAKWLFAGDSLTGRDFYEAVELIIAKAEEQHFLDTAQGKDWIVLSKVDYDNSAFRLDKQKITRAGGNYRMEWFEAEAAQIEDAKKANLSLNKYIVYEKAREKGIRLNEDKLRSQSIASTLAEAGVSPETIFAENGGGPAADKGNPGNGEMKPASPPSSPVSHPPKTGPENTAPDPDAHKPANNGEDDGAKTVPQDGKTKPGPADKGKGSTTPGKPALPPVIGTQPGVPGKAPDKAKEDRDDDDDDDDDDDQDDKDDEDDEKDDKGEGDKDHTNPVTVKPSAPKPDTPAQQTPVTPQTPQKGIQDSNGQNSDDPDDEDDKDEDNDDDEDDEDDHVTRKHQFFFRTPLKRS